MGRRKRAAVYIYESKCDDWQKWCGKGGGLGNALIQLGEALGFETHIYSDVNDEQLTEKQRSKGLQMLFGQIEDGEFKTIFATDISHLLRSGEKESDLLRFFSEYKVRLITIDIREVRRLSGCLVGSKKGHGFVSEKEHVFGNIKNRIGRIPSDPFIPPGWNLN